jgi:hypothetical protein
MLAPKLYELRSKGYAWREIAAWLTEHKVTISVPALQRYLRGVGPAAQKRAGGGRDRKPGSTANADRPRSSRADKEPTELAAASPAAEPTRTAASPSIAAEASARKVERSARTGTFIPRPDTEDL